MTLRQRDTGTGCTAGSLTAFANTGTSGGAAGLATFVVPFGTYRICASRNNRLREAPARPCSKTGREGDRPDSASPRRGGSLRAGRRRALEQ